jgi:peptidyl-prolyl cis-trans isomerase B (cyclophilin B)
MPFILKLSLIVIYLFFLASCGNNEKDSLVTISTKYGDMHMILYDETPKHKENFLKLARENKYDSTVFHRVIQDFMVQAGDINGKEGNQNAITHTVPAEIHPHLIHEKGAVAAARQGDQINPQKASSGDQFYIVKGKAFSPQELDELESTQNAYRTQYQFSELLKKPEYADLRNELIQMQNQGNFEAMQAKLEESKPLLEKEYGKQEEIRFNEVQRNAYTTTGGTPHLDREYTVFGKVIGGMAVIDSIANQRTAPGDRPLEDIYMTVEVQELNKDEITRRFGYEYPQEGQQN